MALADTARLIASLELQDKFSGPARTAEGSLDRLEGKTRTLGRVGGEVSRGLGSLGRNVAIGAAAGVGVIAASVAAGLQSLVRLEEVQAATNAVIESTDGIAQISAKRVRELAEEYESLNATMDDKVIQSAENMLLTFTKITDQAFEPALEAALNMNQAMGGGEEGLQSTIIQVGKALNDPIQGVTALRRVGVQLTKQQTDQIKTLMEQNDLYGAQKIILDELSTQFGGQFAAAGDTAAGKFAKLKDTIEDAQMSLATAFLPVLEKTADKLSTLLADEDVQAKIKQFGEGLAGGLDDVISFAGKLPWAAIGSAFEIAGTGAKAVLTAFSSLPPWVQTAVLTGWGLNKLTGGALGNIVGALGSGLIKGVLGMNAGVVNINAGVVNGGPGGIGGKAGGFGGQVAKGLKVGAALSAVPLVGVAAVEVVNFQNMRNEATGFLEGKLDDLDRNNLAATQASIDKIQDQIDQERPWLEGILFNTNVKPVLERELAELQATKAQLQAAASAARSADQVMIQTAANQLSAQREQARTASEALGADRAMLNSASYQLEAVRGQAGLLGQIRDKKSTVNVNVPITVAVGVSEIQYRIQSLRTTIGGGGFI